MGVHEFADHIGFIRGRGAGLNPGNRFEDVRLHILGEELDRQIKEEPGGRQMRTVPGNDATRSIINRVDSPDLGFNWTINPYRGCEHGCIYCYARPTHELLGYSCGLDFETRIVAKHDAPQLLRRELASPKWKAETIVMSGVTDPYQPLERELRITRGCLEVLVEARQPVSFITKSRLILRDLDLLKELAKFNAVCAGVSLTTLDPDLARTMEPRASSPAARLETIRRLRDQDIPVIVMTAPIIPGLNDHEMPGLLKAAADAGAQGAGWVMLRLPYQIKSLFFEWVARHHPDRLRRVERAIREMRGGELNQSDWGARMRGKGPLADQIAAAFRVFSKRFGLDRGLPPLDGSHFRPPAVDGQGVLF